MDFHETGVWAFHDGRFWILRNDRRLIQYRFERRVAQGVIRPERMTAFAQSPELWKLHTLPAKALRSWDGQGWGRGAQEHSKLLAFTSEYRTAPPREITDLFHELANLPAREERSIAVQDVCLGFCYDPLAALGFDLLQHRTRPLSRSNSGAGGGL